MSFDLIAYGMLMAGLSLAVGRFAPELQSGAWLAGAMGAGAGVMFGLWNGAGKGFRVLSSAVLLAVGLVAVKLCHDAWQLKKAEESGGRIAFAVAGLMTFLSVAQAFLAAFGNKGSTVKNKGDGSYVDGRG